MRKGALKKTGYSDEQLVRILREAGKDPLPEVAIRPGLSEQSIDGWRKWVARLAVDGVMEASRNDEIER